MTPEEQNGGISRYKTLEHLDRYGCAYGQVNREKVENMEERFKSIDAKLWALIALFLGQLLTVAGFLLKFAGAVNAS